MSLKFTHDNEATRKQCLLLQAQILFSHTIAYFQKTTLNGRWTTCSGHTPAFRAVQWGGKHSSGTVLIWSDDLWDDLQTLFIILKAFLALLR